MSKSESFHHVKITDAFDAQTLLETGYTERAINKIIETEESYNSGKSEVWISTKLIDVQIHQVPMPSGGPKLFAILTFEDLELDRPNIRSRRPK